MGRMPFMLYLETGSFARTNYTESSHANRSKTHLICNTSITVDAAIPTVNKATRPQLQSLAHFMAGTDVVPSASARSSRTALYLSAKVPVRTVLSMSSLKGGQVSTPGMRVIASVALSALRSMSSLRSTCAAQMIVQLPTLTCTFWSKHY